jgi:hypothetical protein
MRRPLMSYLPYVLFFAAKPFDKKIAAHLNLSEFTVKPPAALSCAIPVRLAGGQEKRPDRAWPSRPQLTLSQQQLVALLAKGQTNEPHSSNSEAADAVSRSEAVDAIRRAVIRSALDGRLMAAPQPFAIGKLQWLGGS